MIASSRLIGQAAVAPVRRGRSVNDETLGTLPLCLATLHQVLGCAVVYFPGKVGTVHSVLDTECSTREQW